MPLALYSVLVVSNQKWPATLSLSNLLDHLVNLLLVAVHFSECFDLRQSDLFLVSKGNYLVEIENQIERLGAHGSLINSPTPFGYLHHKGLIHGPHNAQASKHGAKRLDPQ
jgi:hypothetical protein